MIRGDERGFGKYILLGIILVLIFLSYNMIAPYILVLISSFIFAYIAKPLFNVFHKKLGKSISAVLCMILIFSVFIVPIALVTTQIATQAHASVVNGDFTRIVEKISTLPYIDKTGLDLNSGVDKIVSFVFSIVGNVASALPSLLLSMILFLSCVFYILYDWDKLVANLKRFIPFDNRNKTINEIGHATHGIVYGYLLVAFIDFVVAAIGLYFIGVKFSLVLAFLIAIMVFIPGLGPSLVFIPLSAYYGLTSNWFSLIAILVLWAIMAIFIETFLSSRILAGRTRIHPIIMLLGILGGTSVFGLFGFVVGPMILVYTIKIVEGLLDRV
jgi:predicted PurR-regulated permease PerM